LQELPTSVKKIDLNNPEWTAKEFKQVVQILKEREKQFESINLQFQANGDKWRNEVMQKLYKELKCDPKIWQDDNDIPEETKILEGGGSTDGEDN